MIDRTAKPLPPIAAGLEFISSGERLFTKHETRKIVADLIALAEHREKQYRAALRMVAQREADERQKRGSLQWTEP